MTAIVEFNQGNYRILEDGTVVGVEVTLVRTGDTTGASDVTVELIEGSASGTDFNTSPIPISFVANETSKTVTIPIVDDFDPESIEKLILFLGNPSWSTEIGNQSAATLEIIDNDSLPIVEFDAASYSVNENDGSVTVALTRIGDTSVSSDVDVFWSDGSASNGSDFNLPPSTLVNFAANQTSATVNVPITDDGDTEGTEIFFANLGGFPSGATIGSQAQTSVEIIDNDGPAIAEFSSGSYSVSENAGMATVALTRTGDTSSSSSVEIALYDGTAVSGVDFGSPGISLVDFVPNQTSATVDIPITNDGELEGQENLFLSLINPSGGSYIGSQGNATLDIIDDDGQSIVELDSSSYSVNEADGVAVATINRSGDIGTSSSVEVLLTDGSATNWVDFGQPPIATVNFAANRSSATVFIPITDDTLPESTEDFTLSLVNPSNGIIGLQDAATVEIVDNDGQPLIEFEAASYSGSEQDGVALVTIKRSGDISSSSSVDVNFIDGTAIAGSDTTGWPPGGTINFAENQSSVTFGVSINDDFDPEITENLTLVLTNPSGADVGYQSTANLDIIDNDGSSVVEFDAASYSVGENGGTAIIQVKRTGDTSASSSVEVLLSERSATNGSDYSNPASNIVNFAPNQSSATVLIPIAEDIDIEGTEELAVQLTNPSWGTNIGKQGAATLEIVDNDGPAIVEFDSASYSGSEDSAVATVLVRRSGDTSNPSTVGLLLSDGSAEATSDVNFSLPTATISFAANQTTATVDIPVIDDFELEETENLFLSLVDPSPGSYIGFQSNATLDIIDNDSSPVVEFDSLSHSVAENEGYAVLNLTRTGDIQYSSSVDIVLRDGSAKSSLDFNTLPSTIVNFAPGQTSAVVAIPVNDDSEIEGSEAFFVDLIDSYIPSISTAIVEIVDNDGPVIVEFASGSYAASEGDSVATIEVKRRGDIQFSSTVDLFLYDRTALVNADVNFTPPSIPVNFAANQSSATVTIPLVDDAEIEGTENLLLSLGSQPYGSTYIGNQSTATLDIVDNDGGSVVELEAASYSVSEGDGVVAVALSRSGEISSESTVNLLLTDGSATNGQDFAPPWSSSISFSANQSRATVLIPITDDVDIEGAENFLLSLANPSTGTIGSQGTASVEIADNDMSPVVEFETASYSVNEDDGKALFTLKRTGNTTSFLTDVEVELVEGTADRLYDFNSTQYTIPASFNPGEDSVTFAIDILEDYDVEGTENLTLLLTNPSGGSIGAQNAVNLEIIDNDSQPVVEFATASYSIAENGGAATIQLKRSGDISSESSVELLLSDGSAWKYSDFNDPISNIIYFAPNQTSATTVVPITDDGEIEGIEDLALELVNPDTSTNIGTRGTATLEIVDNDGPSVVEFAAASYSVAENGGFATINLTREGDTNNPSTVELLLSSGSATDGTDFNNPASSFINFAANQTSATVYVPILEDASVEGTEDLTLELVNPSGGSNIGTQGTATLEIVDNDGPSEIQFAAASYSANENGGFATINVMRSGDASSSSSVEIVASAGSATSSVDFNIPAPYYIDFAANQTSASAVIPIINDADSEGPEDLSLELVNPSGSSLGTQNTATLEIVDDENSPPAIALPGTGLDYIENSVPAVIDSSATVVDANSTDFDGGTLTVSFSSGGTADDRLSIEYSSQIGLSGSDVIYEGTTIGSFSGGSGVADLVVNFNASSTPAAAQALIQNIAYENVSETPAIANRIVEFILTDGDGGTSSAVSQTVRVQAVNDAPAVSPVNLSGDEDTDIAFTAADFTGAFSDIEGDSLVQVKITSLSADGTLKLNGTAIVANQEIAAADLGNLTFTPATNFNGSTTFDWNASDGSDYSPAAAAVNLTVNPVNDAPTVSTVSLSAAEDTDIAFTAADFSNGFGDPEGDSLAKIKITSLPDSGTLALSGTAVTANQEIDAADLGNLVFTPTANFNGTTSFAWNGSDGTSYAAADAEVILAIAVNNDLPEVNNLSLSEDEDTDLAFTAADFTNSFSDSDGDSLVKIKITSLADSGTLALNGTEVTTNQEIDAADLGNLVFTPTANFNGSTSFGWNGFDGIAYAADEATVSVTVNPINDAPVLGTVAIAGDEEAEIGFSSEDFSSQFSDAEGDSLAKVKITSLPSDGTLTLDGTAVSENQEIDPSELGNLVFTPAANFNGSASFGWNGSDGSAYAAAEGTVAVTVNPINDAPTASNFSLSGDEDANIALSSQDFSANFSDSDGDRLAKIKITSLPQNGSLKLDGTAVTANQEIDAADLDNLVFAPAANWNGSTSFGWNGSDETSYAETEATGDLTVNAVNDAPTAGAIAAKTTLKNQSFEFQFAENVFRDIDGDFLNYSAATPAWLSFNPSSRTFSGTPSSSDIGTQVVEVTASDGRETASTSFELTVANSSPTVASAIASQFAIFDQSFEFQFAENIFRDRDGDPLNYSATTPAWLSFDPGSRTFSGTPSSSDIGSQVIEVTASDGRDTASTTFQLTVNASNPPIVANSVFSQGVGFHNGGQFSFAADTYVDPDPGDSITYSIALANTLSYSWYDWARGTNGGRYRKPKEGVVFPEVEMPSWLTFDPATGTINIDEANRPNSFRYGLKVTGTDSSGESASEFIWFKSSALGGFIIDNYIAGAFVFWDANKNGIQDAGEPSTTSDQTGEFDLDVAIEDYDANNNGILDPAEGQIVAFGGIDTATGLPLETPVTATPESTVVTLLTTLVADLVDKGLTVNQANERVAAALSIPSGVDLNSLDPIAATENNEFGGTETLTAMVKVQNAITQTASLVDGASNADFNLIVQNVVEAITSQIQTGGTLDVSNPEVLEAIINDAAGATQQDDANIDLAQVEAIATQAAQVMAESNQQVDALVASGASGTTLTANIANVQKVTLGDITEELEAAAQGTKEIAQVVAENTGAALEAKINPPEPTAPAPVSNPNTPLIPSLPTLVANIELVRNDATEGSDRDDTYIGDDRDNSYLAYSGNDTLFGNSGDDWMNGNRGDDSLDGGEGDDTLYGGKNNDTLSGNNGADVIFGNRGSDSLRGNNGDDFLNGNQAEDILFGGNGNDMLHGGKQNDVLTGGDGSDTLSGDLGNDILTGGDGSDWFVLKEGYDSDILTDFEDGQDFLALANGLTFEQLAISQESGATLIRTNDELLATLENVDASLINSVDFIGVV